MMDGEFYRPGTGSRSSEGSVMDIIGLGTEIVECARVRAMIDEHGERFLNRIYTPEEVRWCQSRTNATEHFAAVWAAKEAVFKSLRVAGRGGSPWGQIEVEFKADSPRVKLRGALRERMTEAGVGNILLATAYARHYATATAVALRTGVG
jgi:holo-[acyl-carrier protein] synthase